MLVKIEEHEHIYIADIEFEKKIFRFKMTIKTVFVTSKKKLLIHANYRKKSESRYQYIFSPKDASLIFTQLQKNGETYLGVSCQIGTKNRLGRFLESLPFHIIFCLLECQHLGVCRYKIATP